MSPMFEFEKFGFGAEPKLRISVELFSIKKVQEGVANKSMEDRLYNTSVTYLIGDKEYTVYAHEPYSDFMKRFLLARETSGSN